MKKRLVAFLLVLIMVLGMLPVSAMAASNSTVVLHPSVNSTVTGVKVKVGDTISGHTVSKISGYDITVDLGKYNVNNDTFRLPYAKDIWEGVDNNKVDYISWAGGGSNKRSEGASALLVNGKNTAYYYFKGAPVLLIFTLNYDANGGTSAPASQTYKATSQYEKSHTFKISTQTPTREGFTFLGWSTNRNATTAERQPGGSIVVTGTTTLYAVWKENTPDPGEDEPRDPDATDGNALVTVSCTMKTAHSSESYRLLSGSYTVSDKKAENGVYTCTVTVTADAYVAVYSSNMGKHTLKGDNKKSFNMTWNKDTKQWTGAGVTFPVECEEEEPPVDPPVGPGDTKPNFTDVNGQIRVQCTAYPSNHEPHSYMYNITDGTYEDNGPTTDENGMITYSISLDRASFITKFDADTKHTHTDEESNADTRIEWRWDANDKAWHLISGPDGITADIKVKCGQTETPPRKPSMSDFANDVLVHCENSSNEHADARYQDIYLGTTDSTRYTEVKVNGENVWQDADGKWTYQIKLDKDKYIEAFNTNPNIKTTHTDTNPEEETYVTWKHDGRQWNLVTVSDYRTVGAVINVTCGPKAPTAGELKELEMAVQVKCVVDASQQHKDAYGLLGECDEDYFVGEPRKDGDDWLCDINYYPERYVAAFNTTFQNLKHVRNDEQIVPVTLIWAGDSWQVKTQGRVPVTEVYTVTYTDGVDGEEVFADQVYPDLGKDSATPAFDGTPTRTGYTFAGWEPEVAATVTETVTYVAKWTPVEPTRDDIFKALNGLVTVTCINRVWYNDDGKLMDCGQVQYGAMAGIVGQDYTIVSKDDTTWVVTFPVTNFVNAFKQDPAHDLYSKDTLSWYIRWEDNTWTSAPVELGVDDVVKLTHAPTNWREVTKITSRGLWTSCENGHTLKCEYGITQAFVSGTDVLSVEPDEGKSGSYIATLNVNKYAEICAKACNDKNFPDAPRTHKLLTQETVQWRLYATPEADEKIGNEVLNHVWAAEPVNPGTDDVCTIAHNWVVTFDPANGGDTFTQDVDYKGKATEPDPAPTKTGYTFDGWYLGKAEKPFDFDTTITSDITLTAKWTQNTYTVTFNANGGEGTMADQTFTYDEEKALTANAFTRTGYTFVNWKDAAGNTYTDGQTVKNLTSAANGEVTLTAQWKANTYTVKFAANGGEGTMADQTFTYDEEKALTANAFTKTGYTFVNWKDAAGNTYTDGQTVKNLTSAANGEVTLTAQWKANTYTVKFAANGGEGTMADQTFTYDEEKALTANAFTKTGYTFVNWKDAAGNTYTDGQTVKNLTSAANGEVTLTAQWKANTYTVKFAANGGVGTMADQTFTYDEEKALNANAFTRAGYTFANWKDAAGNTYTDGQTVKNLTAAANGVVTLTAQWTARNDTPYKVEHYLEKLDGSYTLDTTEDLKGTTDTTATATPKTDYANFTYDGTVVGTVASGNIAGDGSLVLKLYYTRNTYTYTIKHIKQLPDGTYDVANAEVETLNGKFEALAAVTAKNYGSHYPTNDAGTKQNIKVVSGLVIEVRYDLDYHTLTFDTMGGSKIAPETVRHGLTVAKPKDPVNGGYWFDGWYTDKTYRTPYNFATPLTQDTTIYAKWFLIVLPGVTVKKAAPKLNTSDHFAYVQGYPNGTVKPAGNITRAETAAILFRLMDDTSRNTYYSTKSGFRDVAAGSWYNTYVATLNNAGVITDSSNGYFRPNEAITRAELAAMLAAFTDTTRAANYFNDVTANYWAANAIAICAKLGWITGYPDSSFRPDKNVTRAELMAMINRATGRAPKSADAFLPGMKTWSDNTADKWYYLDVQEATNSHAYTVRGSEAWTALTADPNWSKYE